MLLGKEFAFKDLYLIYITGRKVSFFVQISAHF